MTALIDKSRLLLFVGGTLPVGGVSAGDLGAEAVARQAADAALAEDLGERATLAQLDGKADGVRRPGRRWRWLVGDPTSGQYPLALDANGHLWFLGVDVTPLLDVAALRRALALTVDAEAARGVAWAVSDSEGRSPLWITRTGRLFFAGQDVTPVLDGTLTGQVQALAGRVDAAEVTVAGSPDLICWGDSLTAASYPAQLAVLLGRDVANRGIGGQTAPQIAARAGGRAALLTVTGDQIPASGPVTVTTLSEQIMNWSGGAWSLPGRLAGVPGLLHEDGSGGYTFERSEAGAAVPCLPGAPFIPTNTAPDRVHVLWYGRNSLGSLTDPAALDTQRQTIRACIDSTVRAMTGTRKRVIVMGVLSSSSSDEFVGTANFTAKRALAAELARDYPQGWIDIDAILRTHGDGSAGDLGDVANGIVPRSLRADNVHLTSAGYAIVAAAVAAKITENGW